MKTLKLHCIATLFFFGSFASYGQSKAWLSLDEDAFSIQYPSNWELNTSGQMGTSFILLSERSSTTDEFRENINLLVQDISQYNLNLDQFVKLSEEQIAKMITDSEISLNKRTKLNGKEFQQLIYTGKQGELSLIFQQYYSVIDGTAYVLTFTCHETEYESRKSEGAKILDSFNIK
jgi:hypothetical protein